MRFVAALDALPAAASTPAERMRAALALFEEGLEMQRLNLRRRHPELPAAELEAMLRRWLSRAESE